VTRNDDDDDDDDDNNNNNKLITIIYYRADNSKIANYRPAHRVRNRKKREKHNNI
jgi:hypothetical protein